MAANGVNALHLPELMDVSEMQSPWAVEQDSSLTVMGIIYASFVRKYNSHLQKSKTAPSFNPLVKIQQNSRTDIGAGGHF